MDAALTFCPSLLSTVSKRCLAEPAAARERWSNGAPLAGLSAKRPLQSLEGKTDRAAHGVFLFSPSLACRFKRQCLPLGNLTSARADQHAPGSQKVDPRSTAAMAMSVGGAKTIGCVGSVAVLLNNLVGSGIANLPGLFQQTGWLPPTALSCICVLLSVSSSALLVAAMQAYPGNRDFNVRVEYVMLCKHYFTWFASWLFQCLFQAYMLLATIAIIIQTAQACSDHRVLRWRVSFRMDVLNAGETKSRHDAMLSYPILSYPSLYRAMLLCAVMHHNILCYAGTVLYCTVLCYVVQYCAIPDNALLSHTVPCWTVTHHAMPNDARLFRATVHWAVVYFAVPCYAVLCTAIHCYVTFYKTVLCCTLLHCTMIRCSILRFTYYTMSYSTIL